MSRPGSSIVWFRNDLRLTDNPALAAALQHDGDVEAVYVLETDEPLRSIGGAARWWLNRSLGALAADLASLGVRLRVESGTSATIIPRLAHDAAATAVYWNRRYVPAQRDHDGAIMNRLTQAGIACKSFNAALLCEPFDIATGEGRPYSVFTPFWKALRGRPVEPPGKRPASRRPAVPPAQPDTAYRAPGWSKKLAPHWRIGEAAARQALTRFLDHGLKLYPDGRDHPASSLTSRLSPHLRFGEIGPRQIWHAVEAYAAHGGDAAAAEKFLSELAWREFSYHLLYHRPDIAKVPMQTRFADVEWQDDPAALQAWQSGQTGIPIVDAGMRQLWETGWMHNRVRMLTASLLSKNLLIDWRAGERWFWDTLVDADDANNPASWQWVAGCGADAAPYFRVFNPVLQGEKFDAEGAYVRRWVPEIARLDDRWVHRPFEAPAASLHEAGITLGESYPRPIVDLGESRRRAMEALSAR